MGIFFARERMHTSKAWLARDLAATTPDPDRKRAWLDVAARHECAILASTETLLIQR